MDLWCISGFENCGQTKIILPNEVELQNLDLVSTDSIEKKNESEDNTINLSEGVKRMSDFVINVPKIAFLTFQNIGKMDDSSHHYFVGESDERIYVGPPLLIIDCNTFAQINSTALTFFNRNPLNSKGKLIEDRVNTIVITPANHQKSQLIFVAKNGCVVVKSGGYLICELPIVLVKTSGEYMTISGGSTKLLRLKPSTHLALFVNLRIPVPIIFMRKDNKQNQQN